MTADAPRRSCRRRTRTSGWTRSSRSPSTHDGGAVDLSIGTPCDPPPAEVLAALVAGDTARGYPPSIGTPAFRAAAAGWIERRLGATVDPQAEVAAVVGTKEFVGTVPQYLRLRRPDLDTVLYPAISYPTYAMGATLAGCRAVAYERLDDIADADAERVAVRLGQLARQPDRRAARPRRQPPRGGVPAASRCSRTSATPSSAGPAARPRSCAAGTDGRARGALAVQAGQLRRSADRLLRRRSGARPLPARDPQARRADAARPRPGRRDRGARRRRARRGAARAVPAPPRDCCATCSAGSATTRRCRTARSTSGCLHRTATPGRAARDLAERVGVVVSPGEFYGPYSTGHFRVAAVQPDERIELALSRA